MEENSFEKQVQQRMDELKIQPSDGVWGKIEVQIAKKGNRKRGLIILFLFIGLLLTGGYWLWNTGHQKAKDGVVRNNKQENIVQNNTSQQNNAPGKIYPTTDSMNHENNVSKEKSFNEKNVYNGPVVQNKAAALPRTNIKIKTRGQNIVVTLSETDKIADVAAGKVTVRTSLEKGENQISFEMKQVQSLHLRDDNPVSLKNSDDPLSIGLDRMNDILKKPISKDEIPKYLPGQFLSGPIRDPVVKNKWHFGIDISGGVSGINNSVLTGGSYADYLSSPSASGQSTGPYNYTLSFKNGFGYLAGIFAEKNITRKIRISFGLNFRSFKSIYNPGIDTGIFYNSQLSVKNYRAHYNFIDLPVNIRFLVGRPGRPAILLKGGLVVSEMIGVDALQFDASKGYYKDNSLFNKTQLGFNGAVYTTIFSRQKHPVFIGPYFYYGLSEIASRGLFNKKHFSFAGLRTEILLNK